MTDIDKTMTNRKGWGEYVANAAASHSEVLAEQLTAVSKTLGVKPLADTAEVARWLAELMLASNTQMITAESQLNTEATDAANVRDARDTATVDLSKVVNDVREVVSLIQPSARARLGFAAPIPEQPALLLTYATEAIKDLNNDAKSYTVVAGTVINTKALADELAAKTNPLAQAIADQTREKQEWNQALQTRDGAVDTWHRIYSGVATALEGLLRLTSLDTLAERVRPTKNKRLGDTAPPDTSLAQSAVSAPTTTPTE